MVELKPFSSVEAPTFQQIFNNLLGIDLPLKSATTVKRHLIAQLKDSQSLLKQELDTTCKTIGLLLDVWTSKNHLAVLDVVGHWLTQEFKYKERVLEFKELEGVHSGENMAQAVDALLEELGL